MRHILSFAIVMGLGTLGHAALADEGHGTRVDRVFARLDTNGDGKISRDEAQHGKRLANHFDAIDADKDGFITRSELQAFLDNHHR